jgi:hypothetical protein
VLMSPMLTQGCEQMWRKVFAREESDLACIAGVLDFIKRGMGWILMRDVVSIR